MKQDYPHLGFGFLCRLFGKTRHAYYDHLWRSEHDSMKEEIILQLVHEIRGPLPRLGTRKMLFLLQPMLESHGISAGRDYLFELFGAHKLLIRQRRKKIFTTDSRHWMHKYSNLVAGVAIIRPEQLWVSDMTYIRVMNQWGYLSLVTDAFSRKIMGYCFRSDMLASGCVAALQMALDNRSYSGQPLTHHSDRGSQYCCRDYVGLLNCQQIAISMTQNGDPYENALAERMNGILKSEFNLYSSSSNFEQTYGKIHNSVKAYNELRPHGSCDYLTPCQAHRQAGVLAKRWKAYAGKWQKEKPAVLPLQ
ncbi:IS3 family transposase [Mucilaginibacter sp.]|uniref:IS3 family transposase n=1 Tax=Mucilaginibacter sp. TaxID=1882438 RepID=UPI003267A1F2